MEYAYAHQIRPKQDRIRGAPVPLALVRTKPGYIPNIARTGEGEARHVESVTDEPSTLHQVHAFSVWSISECLKRFPVLERSMMPCMSVGKLLHVSSQQLH